MVKVGSVYRMFGSYDGEIKICITAVGISGVLYVTIPLVIFNGKVEEYHTTLKDLKENFILLEESNV